MQRVIFISAQHQVVDLMQTSNHLAMFDASMPTAAVQLRMRTNAPMVPIAILRQKRRFLMKIEPIWTMKLMN